MSLLGIIQIPFERYFQKQRECLLRTLCSILIFLFLHVNGVTFTKPKVILNLNFEIDNTLLLLEDVGLYIGVFLHQLINLAAIVFYAI